MCRHWIRYFLIFFYIWKQGKRKIYFKKGIYAYISGKLSGVFPLQFILYLLKLLLCTFLAFLVIHNFLLSFSFYFSLCQLLPLNMLMLFPPSRDRSIKALHCISLCSLLFTTVPTCTNTRIHNSDTPEVVNIIGTIFMSWRLKISPLRSIAH